MGDFNQVLSPAEKQGGNPACPRRMSQLLQVLDSCALIDLGYAGPAFTWSNMCPGRAHIQARLDWSYCNQQWLNLFPAAHISHLPRLCSDHHPLLLSLTLSHRQPSVRPFRVLNAWYLHPSFQNLVRDVWDPGGREVYGCLDLFRDEVIRWNRFVFGNIFDRKFRCLACLAGIQQKVNSHPSQFLSQLEQSLRMELQDILLQEEALWRQKSHVQWLQQGERNTRFFHLSTLNRRRKNMILQLKCLDGTWCTDPMTLKAMASVFYIDLYTVTPCQPSDSAAWSFPSISHYDRSWLNLRVTEDEVKRALFQMGPDKAPGPDGFPPSFFQRYWDIVGASVVDFVHTAFLNSAVPSAANQTLIVLLPKVDSPESLTQFRPISLCNVLVKLVSNVLANRLQPLMTKLTGKSQSSFIPGHLTIDNIIVAQEVLHTLR